MISAAPAEGAATGSAAAGPPIASTDAPVGGADQAAANANGLCSA